MEIPETSIGAVIGSGGKVIQELQKQTDTTIVIEEEDGVGVVEILGVNQEKIDNAIRRIKEIIFEPEVGEVYEVTVAKILDFGAVVEFFPGKDVLLHISELTWGRVEKVSDVVKVGDKIHVKYMGIDPKTRKPKVSRRLLMKRPPRKDDFKKDDKQ